MILYILIGVAILLLVINIALTLKSKSDGNSELLKQQIELSNKATSDKIGELSGKMNSLTEKNYEQQIKLMETLSANSEKQTKDINEAIGKMQESNEKKLEEMRSTVDEKLTKTLNTRLNESFETVSKQLGAVYRSLGEMQKISGDVTTSVQGLNRVLTNVKSRGTWAEVQLGNILDQTIPGMYETNVKTNAKYNGQVEFAVKIPSAEDDTITWLPIDSKFPMEDYARLSAAAEAGDADSLEAARKALETRIKAEAKDITKYIDVPNTTPFAIMYLATEGLYAEVMSSKSGVAETLQAQNIMLAGPSTITALLNSLAMGFRSIAINKKASEVYDVLGAAKAQYEKFGTLLETARKRIESAGKAIGEAENKNSYIQRKLKTVETLDSAEANNILGIEEATD
ncbi:MAG: DNA recombination protein RmuC [Eubacterium sp.]|nr:DNA recombination protein RmuC [Eubacterium sp.]MBQ8981242.1 DNA recombination protein RmuC [Eubacterium sp.]